MTVNEAILKHVRRPDLQPEHYLAKSGKPAVLTKCNFFIQSVCAELGVNELVGKHANNIVMWMSTHQTWLEIDAATAQTLANGGHLVIAGWANPNPVASGHVAFVVSGQLGWSKKHKKDMPMLANVGHDNFYGRLASFAFSPERPPRYFTWIGRKPLIPSR